MKKYDFIIRYAIYIKDAISNDYDWMVNKKKIEVSAENIYAARCKAVDELKKGLRNRNPLLDEALNNKMVFTDILLMI